MTIKFTIKDDIGAKLQTIAETNAPTLTGGKAINKFLKEYISSLMDDKPKTPVAGNLIAERPEQPVLGNDIEAFLAIKAQIEELQRQQALAHKALFEKNHNVLPTGE